MVKKRSHYFHAVATLVGTTIGAGILGIPYVVAQSGMLIGLATIILIGLAIMMINLYLGEICLRTKGNHQLTGYAEKYLGKIGKNIMTATMIFGIYGALLAYIIGVGASLSELFPITPLIGSIIYFIIAALIVYLGLKAVEKSELLLVTFVLIVVSLIIAFSLFSSHFSTANLMTMNTAKALTPYGVILFAFLGAAAVPEMKEELTKSRKELKRAIVIAGIIPIIVYSLFAIAVVGVSGMKTSEVATIQLGELFGQKMMLLTNTFAILAMSTSFIALGLALKGMYNFDYKFSRTKAWLLTCLVPITAYILGIHSFIKIVGLVGAVAGGTEGILFVLMHSRARKKSERKPEYSIKHNTTAGIAISVMFALGIIYSIIKFF